MQTSLIKSITVALLASVLSTVPAAGPVKTVDHPSKIVFDRLNWQVPLGTPYRHVLSNGLRAYIAADSSVPMITVVGYVKYGDIADPAEKEGAASLLARLMRAGGTAKYPPDTLDLLLDLLAVRASFSAGETQMTFTFTFLSDYLDTACVLMREMLFNPAFDKGRLLKERESEIQKARHRFDNPGPVIAAAFEKAMYPGQPNTRLSTEKSLNAVSRDDLVALHRKVLRTANIIVGVSGKFDPALMKGRLGAIFPAGTADSTGKPFPAVRCEPAVKAMIVHKKINQAYVKMGIPLFARPHPDYYPVSVMNMIFGSGGFTSRLSNRIRSDEGLTYSIHSEAGSNYVFPATLSISFFTKTESVVRAIRLVREEIERLRKDGVTPGELDNARATLIDALPSSFRNADDIAEQYAWNEYYGRPDSIYRQYPAAINAVGRDDVLKMAVKYLDFDKMTFVIVGDTGAVFAVDTASDFSLRKLAPVQITLPDSLATRP